MDTNDALRLDLPLHIDAGPLRLQVPQPGDGAMLCDAITESLTDLRRFLSALPWVAAEPSPAASEAWCRRSQANFLARTDLPFLMRDAATGRVLGACGLHRPDWQVPKLEVGYWCRTSVQGQGWVTRAVTALTQYAFTHVQAVRVELVTDTENAASRRVAERCGFTLEGVRRHVLRTPAGELRSLCDYARLRENGD